MAEIIRIPGEGEIVGDQFVLRKQIGRGGYGVVFEALQTGVERPVAIKMLLPRVMEDQKSVVDRFKREARLASSLRHHCAVTIFAFGVHHNGDPETLGLPYIAMELLEGESLQEHLIRSGPMSQRETSEVLEEVLESLGEAHRKGIIHRDIKPDNVFLHQPEGEQRVIKVLDFGISMAFTQNWDEENRTRLTETGLVTGTAEYMAPEQVLGETVFTPAIDVYAVGCMAFQLLTGKFPYHGSTPVEIAIKHINSPTPSLPEEFADTRLAQVVSRAMNKDPKVRFKDASEFLHALRTGELREIIPSTQVVLPPPAGAEDPQEMSVTTAAPNNLAQAASRPSPPTRKRNLRPVLAIAVSAVAMVAVVSLALHFALGESAEDPERSSNSALEEAQPKEADKPREADGSKEADGPKKAEVPSQGDAVAETVNDKKEPDPIDPLPEMTMEVGPPVPTGSKEPSKQERTRGVKRAREKRMAAEKGSAEVADAAEAKEPAAEAKDPAKEVEAPREADTQTATDKEKVEAKKKEVEEEKKAAPDPKAAKKKEAPPATPKKAEKKKEEPEVFDGF